jgi:uncharacterized protein YjbI with pentapeptide repeats
MVLSRYALITTRRWIIASLIALIAAMAALAGTALLYKQNLLIAVQSSLLREQNTRIQEQTVLLRADVELAEAARNSALAVEITQIAAELGKITDRVHGADLANPVNVLDPATDLGRGLVLRITSVSSAVFPYRYLDNGLREEDMTDGMRFAMQDRRKVLGDSYARMVDYFGWAEPREGTNLTDRPASPERGQLLSVLMSGGVRNLELLTVAGLNLDFAILKARNFLLVTAQQARLAYADFSGSYFVECDFGSAMLDNARFRSTKIDRTRFAAPAADQYRPPFTSDTGAGATRMSGADFNRATVTDSDFSGVILSAASFDGALLNGVSFAAADLSATTFQGTIIVAADFAEASVKRTDFDGAIVFGDDFLTRLAGSVAPDTFRPELFELVPLDPAEPGNLMVVYNALTPEDLTARTKGEAPFRITRIGDF